MLFQCYFLVYYFSCFRKKALNQGRLRKFDFLNSSKCLFYILDAGYIYYQDIFVMAFRFSILAIFAFDYIQNEQRLFIKFHNTLMALWHLSLTRDGQE